MSYVQLSSWNKTIKVGEDFIIKVSCNDDKQIEVPGGYAVNFQAARSEESGIIFHFNPRAPQSTVVLNTLKKTTKKWGTEVRIVDSKVKDIYFSRVSPFELKLKIISDDTFHVYVNNSLKTEYQCEDGMKITETKYIIFSPFITIDR